MNLLTLAAKNVGKPEMVNDFFNQRLLKAPDFKLPKAGMLEKDETQLAVDLKTFDPEAQVQLISLGTASFLFGLSHDGKLLPGKQSPSRHAPNAKSHSANLK